MKRLLILMFAVSVSTPALAQHSGHTAPQAPPASPPICTPEHAAMGHCRMPATTPTPAPTPAPRSTCTPEHAAMGHCTMPAPKPTTAPAPAPASTCTPEHAAMGHCTMPPATSAPATPADPHAGHVMPPPQQATDPHAGHQMPAAAQESPPPPVASPPPEAFSGPAHAADAVFGTEPMAEAREELRETHGDMRAYRVGIDQLEVVLRDGRDGYAWEDLHFWYGGDINRLWIKSEGEGEFGGPVERAEIQALWSRAISPFFDLQAGVRYDIRPNPERAYLVLGLQGLAPYWFEVDGAVFVSHRGDITARFEGEYDQRITQRLILQPRVELDFSLQDVPELGIGSGLSSAEAGLRLRYEIVPEFAPYVGVQYERAFGGTARFSRAAGEDVGGWSLVMGVRAWF